jgi:hypothetical protein
MINQEYDQYEVFSKLWRYSGVDYNVVGKYKLGTVEIEVEDCDGDFAYLIIRRYNQTVVEEEFRDEDLAYKKAEDYLEAIGFLVRDEKYKEMKLPRVEKVKFQNHSWSVGQYEQQNNRVNRI